MSDDVYSYPNIGLGAPPLAASSPSADTSDDLNAGDLGDPLSDRRENTFIFGFLLMLFGLPTALVFISHGRISECIAVAAIVMLAVYVFWGTGKASSKITGCARDVIAVLAAIVLIGLLVPTAYVTRPMLSHWLSRQGGESTSYDAIPYVSPR